MREKLYVAGKRVLNNDGEMEFEMIGMPAAKGLPFYTYNRNSKSMEGLATTGAALYEYNPVKCTLTSVDNDAFEITDRNVTPLIVHLTQKARDLIIMAKFSTATMMT